MTRIAVLGAGLGYLSSACQKYIPSALGIERLKDNHKQGETQ